MTTTEHVPHADPFDPDMLEDTTFTLGQITRARRWEETSRGDRVAAARRMRQAPQPHAGTQRTAA